jgi:hypothetical protein
MYAFRSAGSLHEHVTLSPYVGDGVLLLLAGVADGWMVPDLKWTRGERLEARRHFCFICTATIDAHILESLVIPREQISWIDKVRRFYYNYKNRKKKLIAMNIECLQRQYKN